MAKQFEVELSLVLFGLHLSLSTPDFSIPNPAHRPGLWPKWVCTDYQKQGLYTECRYSFRLDWLFHFTAAWGGETKPPDLNNKEPYGTS